MRFLITCLALLLPQTLWASCQGTDLRASFPPETTAALNAVTTSTPFPEGNYWRATRDGQVINVIGTLHIYDPRLDTVVEKLTPVIAQSERLFAEANQEDMKKLEREIATNSEMMLLKDKTLIEFLDEETWQTLSDAARARGIPSFMAAKMRPWYLSMMLSIPGCAMPTFIEGKGLDKQLLKIAEENNVPASSLEDYMTVFNVFNEDPIEEQLRALQLSVFSEEVASDMFVTTINAYFDEKHAELWELSRIMARDYVNMPADELEAELDDFQDKLLVQRNLNWIDVLLEADEQELTVAVGVAHLMGESGLLNQLQTHGYQLERQPF